MLKVETFNNDGTCATRSLVHKDELESYLKQHNFTAKVKITDMTKEMTKKITPAPVVSEVKSNKGLYIIRFLVIIDILLKFIHFS